MGLGCMSEGDVERNCALEVGCVSQIMRCLSCLGAGMWGSTHLVLLGTGMLAARRALLACRVGGLVGSKEELG